MMRSLAISAAVVAITAAAGCGGGSSETKDPPLTVAQRLEQFERAYQSKDAAAIAAMCSYPFQVDGASIDSAETLQAFLQGSFDAAGVIEVAELLDPVITEDGDAVTVTGSFHVVDATSGEYYRTVTIQGVRVDGVWKGSSFSQEE